MRYLSSFIILSFLFIFNSCDTSTTMPLNDESDIVRFTIGSHFLVGEIDNINKTIRIKITPDIDRTSLVPTIQVSRAATVYPPSETAIDFTAPVDYTVTAEDGSTTTYSVYADVGNYILNSCLHIVHMQNHFIYGLGIYQSAELISSISTILQSARDENIPVVFSKSMPAGDREIISELTPRTSEIVIESSTDVPTVEAITNLGVGTVVVAGVITHQCIKDICEALKNAGLKVILVKDATSVQQSQDASLIESTCNELEQAGTVELILRDEILF